MINGNPSLTGIIAANAPGYKERAQMTRKDRGPGSAIRWWLW
jgi:hypothetical protein